jgi:O-antigen/teichoic acid export membrane protein
MITRIKNFLFHNTSEKQTVAKNTFWLTASEIISRLLRFGLIIYVARILGTEGWGLFSYALSLIGIALVISDGGSSLFFTKEYTEKRNIYIKTILFLKLILLLITTTIAIITGFFFASLPIASLVIPVTIILVSDSIRDFLNTFFRVQEKMEKEAFIKILTNLILIITSVILVTIHRTPESLAIGYLVGSIAGTFFAYLVNISFIRDLKKIINHKDNSAIDFITVLKIVLPITLTGIAGTVMVHIDTVMLGIWTDAEQVGLYAAAQRIVQFSLIVPGLFIAALYPTLTKIYNQDQKQFVLFAKKIVNILFIIGTPIAVGGYIVSQSLMLTLFGPEYLLSGPAFSWLIIGSLFIFPGFLFHVLVIITEQQQKLVRNICIIICATILFNIILIPTFGITGAAIGTTLAHTGLFIINRTLFTEIISLTKETVRDIVIATTFMVGTLLLLQRLPILIVIFMSGLIYGAILIFLKNKSIISILTMLREKTP